MPAQHAPTNEASPGYMDHPGEAGWGEEAAPGCVVASAYTPHSRARLLPGALAGHREGKCGPDGTRSDQVREGGNLGRPDLQHPPWAFREVAMAKPFKEFINRELQESTEGLGCVPRRPGACRCPQRAGRAL